MATAKCIECLVEFHVPPVRLKTAKFCSRVCANKHGVIRDKVSKIIPCLHCNQPVKRYPSTIKKSGVFCSKKCFDDHRRIYVFTCKNCGVVFHGGDKHRQFCNQSCMGVFQRKAYDPNKKLARAMVANAMRSGGLIMKPCFNCGYAYTEAHHEDYLRPLEVIWLCATHHKELHRGK